MSMKKTKNCEIVLLTFSISHFLNLQYSDFASYSGVRYSSLVSKAQGYHSGCNLIFSFSRRMLDLFGVIIMIGICASGIVFCEAPVILCFRLNCKTYCTLNIRADRDELGPAANGFSTKGIFILASSESDPKILMGMRNSNVLVSVFLASQLLSIFSLHKM